MKLVFAVHCDLLTAAEDGEARLQAWSWVEKFGFSPPNDILDEGGGVLTGGDGHSLTWQSLVGDRRRVLRMVHEAPPGGGSSTGWVTHVWVCEDDDHAWGVVRSGPLIPPGLVTSMRFDAGIPRVVRMWAEAPGLVRDGRRLQLRAATVGVNDVDWFLGLLADPRRALPVVGISAAAGEEYRVAANHTFIARELLGNAHVVTVGRRASWSLTNALGKEYSVYDGAVRIWWPRMSPSDDPYRHKLYLQDRLESSGGHGERDLVRRIWRAAVDAVPTPRLESVLLAERRRADLDRLNAALRSAQQDSNAGSWAETWAQFEQMNAELTAENAELTKAVESLSLDVEDLREALSLAHSGRDIDDDDEQEVSSVEEAVRVAAAEFDRLVFLPSAYASARDSEYPSPDQVLADLRALGRVATKWASGEMKGDFRSGFASEPVKFQPDIGQTAETKYRADYEIEYAGEKVLMAPHLRRGTGPPAQILRIYWYVDSVHRQLVVGHVGRKLRDKSNPG